ncbi:MAG TPA: PCYCGC motif-containing (lipo)protein [Gemmatimonadales bacterium]|nr:PCYCGC motif-containing (lipo)protein [Gemmatimonadales bacterium]
MSAGKTPWLVAGGAAAALVVVLFAANRPAAGGHPDPRPGITAERVLAPGAVPRTPGAAEGYAAARAAPQALDGTYCHCDCARHSGHRSLLTCFESEHGAYCDICIGEAVLVARMAAEGRALDEIRRAVDRQFGS